MSFYLIYKQLKDVPIETYMQSVSEADVRVVLTKQELNQEDLLALLSPAAERILEEIAEQAHRLTVQHFGKTIQLFNPLYVSDYCVNHCTYCSFSVTNEFERKILTEEEIEVEAQTLRATGIEHVLLLTGESKQHTPVSYLKDCVKILRKYFSSIAIEVNPLDTEEYEELFAAGVDGVTVYQETYNEDIYKQYHVKGPKRNYLYRLDTPERACEAGMRSVNIGALLGLDDWRKEVFLMAMHAQYLQTTYLGTEISVSLPRIRPTIGDFIPTTAVYDRYLVQCMLALRLFLPRSGITLSTRESPELRDHLLPLGVTKMSAGASTEVGGYSQDDKGTNQFEISDERNVNEISEALIRKGYQPIYKDWVHL
ncbi:2-iminoacetate synthase ThiH [Desertibacillus haloalkaliphilus]|uniref:2-iminoacetate synthase ThiH n=1 Tax=Desertibacillus haloalkaliphilus TaxID=1328930 RepID=UPI001C25282A|nr:2-iminoacetate synthase ThiH [Desertibacillus haloalkaliphilus]MBU8905815.1 2-iminoacetate synthase ThiH [Desertibacillus haloalkaliphilus]